MKTQKYTFIKKYNGYEKMIDVNATEKQIRFSLHGVCIGKIRIKKYKAIVGCSINDKTGYVLTLYTNNTKYLYTFDTANQAIEKSELLFGFQLPDEVKNTFKANELLQRLTNKI